MHFGAGESQVRNLREHGNPVRRRDPESVQGSDDVTEFQRMTERKNLIMAVLDWFFALLIVVLYTAAVVGVTLVLSKR